MINGIDPALWLDGNASLQAKKNVLRKYLKKKGVLKQAQSLSETELKKLLTDALLYCKLEIKVSTIPGFDAGSSHAEDLVEIELIDAETGFGEASREVMSGRLTRYEAYTEALKDWMANTMLISFTEVTEARSEVYKGDGAKASPEQVEFLAKSYRGENLKKLLEVNHVEKLEDIPAKKAAELITKINTVKGGK